MKQLYKNPYFIAAAIFTAIVALSIILLPYINHNAGQY